MADKAREAHNLAEHALDEAEHGDTSEAKRLADKAKKLDPKAVQEVVDEVEKERAQAEKFAKEQ